MTQPVLPGDTVYRVHWVLGTDLLLGVCHCGAEHTADDPVELWEWLLGHPEGHVTGVPRPTDPEPARRPEPAGVG